MEKKISDSVIWESSHWEKISNPKVLDSNLKAEHVHSKEHFLRKKKVEVKEGLNHRRINKRNEPNSRI